MATTFSLAQTFYVDPTTCGNASKVHLTEIALYVRAKPYITGNRSGIQAPGLNVGIVPCQYGVPLIGQPGIVDNISWSRAEYGQIVATNDASVPTIFRFNPLIDLYPGLDYAIIIKADADEDFVFWVSKKGDPLIGSTAVSPGASGRFAGKLFAYISNSGQLSGTGVGYSNSQTTDISGLIPNVSSQNPFQLPYDQSYLLNSWKPTDDVDLKFQVGIARYMTNGYPVNSNSAISDNPAIPVWNDTGYINALSNNVLQISAPSVPSEFLVFDKTQSQNIDTINFGDYLYQARPYFSGGKQTPVTCSISNGSFHALSNTNFVCANGSNFGWPMVFGDLPSQPTFGVFTSLNHDGPGLHRVNVRQIVFSVNNDLTVAETFNFNNTAAYFFAAPVGVLSGRYRTFGLGNAAQYVDMIVLSPSSANSTCRFVNNDIEGYTITANGSGYSNSDYLTVTGFESVSAEVSGGYAAFANVLTNNSGAIVNLYFTNTGCGFVNTGWLTGANVKFANSTSGTSAGSGATLTFQIGATVKAQTTTDANATISFSNCQVYNIDASQVIPQASIVDSSGTSHNIIHRSLYYSANSANTFSGKHYFVTNDPSTTDFSVVNGLQHNFSATNAPTIVSRSNQFSIRYANGAIANNDVIGQYWSNNVTYLFNVSSNNDFVAVSLDGDAFASVYDRYIINNDYTNENTNSGNAWAKHISTSVTLANGYIAEDLVVYLTGWRPPNTDFKVYGKIWNPSDTDAFDTKDWTLLEQVDGIGVYSNPLDQTDLKEFTYNFRAYPNTDYTSVGTVTTTLNSNVVTGSGTNFSANLAVNDMVKVWQPLFPNNYMVSVVSAITNATSITLTDLVTNNGIVGSGLKIDRIKYPHQGYNDVLNSNVVAYYNSNMARFDGYSTFAVKIVFLSSDPRVPPKLGDYRSIAVTS